MNQDDMAATALATVDDAHITACLRDAQNATDEEIGAILDRAERFEGLSHHDVAALLCTKSEIHTRRIFDIAGKIKEHIYGDRVVLFAPLYVSDYCVNKCAYCGFNCENTFGRRRLTMPEIEREVRILESMGHKRLALEAGEDPVNCPIDYILDCLKTIYAMKFNSGEIRRVNVNIASTTVENYRKLADAGIGTYILFQETYHRATYEKMHLGGPKRSYDYHLTAFHRAMEGGIDDVGAGVLFGLYDPAYEVIGLMLHNEALEKRFGVGFHTISTPRLCPAEGVDQSDYPHMLGDDEFKRIVAIIRLAVPFTGMIISTRESQQMRRELIKIGVSQVSAGSAVEVGGYGARETHSEQFHVSDCRAAGEIIEWLLDEGVVPSFCTACYRTGRTGDRFMALAKSGNIKNVCLPNALMSLWEYALDYGSDSFREKSRRVIDAQMANIGRNAVRDRTREGLAALDAGRHDQFL